MRLTSRPQYAEATILLAALYLYTKAHNVMHKTELRGAFAKLQDMRWKQPPQNVSFRTSLPWTFK